MNPHDRNAPRKAGLMVERLIVWLCALSLVFFIGLEVGRSTAPSKPCAAPIKPSVWMSKIEKKMWIKYYLARGGMK